MILCDTSGVCAPCADCVVLVVLDCILITLITHIFYVHRELGEMIEKAKADML